MARRKHNPSPLTILAVSVAAGAGIWALVQGQKKAKAKAKAKKKKTAPTNGNGKKKKSSGGKKTPTTGWPPDLTEQDKNRLEILGYAEDPEATLRFQTDYNDVTRELIDGNEATDMAAIWPIKEDNKIGPTTRTAMQLAKEDADSRLVLWQDLVEIYG